MQAGGLKGVPCEHEKAEGGAGQQLFPFESAKNSRAEGGHEQRGQRESSSKENEDRRIVERIFDDDECRAPEQAAECQREIGAESFGHERHISTGERASVLLALRRDNTCAVCVSQASANRASEGGKKQNGEGREGLPRFCGKSQEDLPEEVRT